MSTPMDRNCGFTLIELLIAVVIFSILAGLSVTSYSQYVRRSQRVDATAALLRISAAQERFYLQNGRYAGNGERTTPPPAGLGMTGTEHGYYDLSIVDGPDGLALGYLAVAAPASGGPQRNDDQCQLFSIDQSGARGALNDAGSSSPEITDRCWR